MVFYYYPRGYKKTVVILPGWGFDCRMFEECSLQRNIVAPAGPLVKEAWSELAGFLEKNRLKQVGILGWSLGAAWAAEFSKRHEDLAECLILVSARASWPLKMIADLERQIREDRIKALKKFYLTAFYSQKADYRLFRKKHLSRLLELWKEKDLLRGLKFLLDFPVKPHVFKKTRLLMVHGSNDLVAPPDAIPSISSAQGCKKVIMEGTGHLPFLHPEFPHILEDL